MQSPFFIDRRDIMILYLNKKDSTMKKIVVIISVILMTVCLFGCSAPSENPDVVATTKPVYDFTAYLCSGTGLSVQQLITENVSCLHDYTLQVRQMRAIEAADAVILSGAGLEDFLEDALTSANTVIDASRDIALHCGEHHHEEDGHHHDNDPHIWLSIENARKMAENICLGLSTQYPECAKTFSENLNALNQEFDNLKAYAETAFSTIESRNLITFHDGFSYFAEEWDLHILRAVEEESGSEASAAELKELIGLIRQYELAAIFTEENSSASAAGIIAKETGISVYTLSMGMSVQDYFETMYHNIDTVKEALG